MKIGIALELEKNGYFVIYSYALSFTFSDKCTACTRFC